MSGVQSICHPFATVIFKIITEQRKGSEHAEQSADSLPIFVRARPCFTLWSFSLIRKTELWKTNKPPAVRMVEVASAYSIKPPLLNNVRFANRII